jgi:hypothetical protein
MGFIGSLLLILDLNSCRNADLALEEAMGFIDSLPPILDFNSCRKTDLALAEVIARGGLPRSIEKTRHYRVRWWTRNISVS